MCEGEGAWQIAGGRRRRRDARGAYCGKSSSQTEQAPKNVFSKISGSDHTRIRGRKGCAPSQGYKYVSDGRKGQQRKEETKGEKIVRELERLNQLKELLKETDLWKRLVRALGEITPHLSSAYAFSMDTVEDETDAPQGQPVPTHNTSTQERHKSLSGETGSATEQGETGCEKHASHLRPIRELVCYGIGNFSDAHNSRYQLALALCLRDLLMLRSAHGNAEDGALAGRQGEITLEGAVQLRHNVGDHSRYASAGTSTTRPNSCSAAAPRDTVDVNDNSITMLVFDPVMNDIEKAILYKLGCEIPIDEAGKRRCSVGKGVRMEQSAPARAAPMTLFFMPHCPWWMYNNVLWANWSAEGIGSFAILGNTLSAYRTSLYLAKEAEPTDGIMRTEPLFREIEICSKEATRRRTGRRQRHEEAERLPHMRTAFSDMTLSYSSLEARMSVAGSEALAHKPPEDLTVR